MTNKKLDVTACILSLNRPIFLQDALESVLSQTGSPEEVRVYDNGSEGNVLNAVKTYLAKGVNWYGADFTQSVFWNFRRAVIGVKTKYVFIMHDDDKLCSDFLEKQIDFLDKHPDVVAVSCNGYLINENGKRNGCLVIDNTPKSQVEFYECSGDVALKYASDSCIPFSPVVYRSELLRQVDLREEYGKVCDAVLFCDIADVGTLAYQPLALYECRVHDGQDSSYFSSDILLKLECFLLTRKTRNEKDRILLQNLLIIQHTSRKLRSLLRAFKRPFSFSLIWSEVRGLGSDAFSFWGAVKIVTRSIFKRVTNTFNYKSKLNAKR